jgi:hypothetical protein
LTLIHCLNLLIVNLLSWCSKDEIISASSLKVSMISWCSFGILKTHTPQLTYRVQLVVYHKPREPSDTTLSGMEGPRKYHCNTEHDRLVSSDSPVTP